MKVLVTGGTGFLGRHLVPRLVEAGHAVRVLVRSSPRGLETSGAELVRGDVLEREGLAAACAGVEAVYHLAGRVQHKGEASELFQLHVEGTRNVVRAAAAAAVSRLVHLSSSGTIAVSKDPGRVADETAPYALETVRRWPYYLSKIYAEKVALEAQASGALSVVVLSPTLLLGPGDDDLSSSQLVTRFLAREVPAVPPGGLSFVDVRDAAAAALAALDRARPGERYLLGGPNMTLEALFVLLGKVSGCHVPTVKATSGANDLAARLVGALEDVGGVSGDESVAYGMAGHYWYLDAAKARRELGFEARSPEATLRDAVAWIRARGVIPKSQGTIGALFRGVQRAIGRA